MSVQRPYHVIRCNHVGLAGEDALGQKIVNVGLLVGATVLDHY